MKIMTNKEIKRLFIIFMSTFVIYAISVQTYCLIRIGSIRWELLFTSLVVGIALFGYLYYYFLNRQKTIEEAIFQIDSFVSGNTERRIECKGEGELNKLFHSINMLATSLDAQAIQEKKMQLFLKNMISDVSHQLKTPLSALAIYNSLIQEEAEDTESVKSFARKSEKEIERIDTLIQNLLKITRLDSGMITMEKAKHNIFEMVTEIKASFDARVSKELKNISVNGSSEASILCDKDWLIEAISNVIKNAIDHTSEGGEINIYWHLLPTMTQIVIKDNGMGIHPEDIHYIFKRFYRSRFSKNTQGSGLGLSLSKAIIEAHEGNITVESTLDEGTTFFLNFFYLT